MRIDVVAPAELCAEDIEAWAALQAADPALGSPYLSPHWTLACAGVDGPDRAGAAVLVVRDGEAAVGFLPVRRSRGAALAVGTPLCDCQGLVARPDVRLDPQAALRALGVGRLDFSFMLADQPAFAPFAQGTSQSQVIDISQGYEAYAAGRRDGGHRILRDAAKKRRRLERDHGAVTFTALSDSALALERLIALKRRQFRATRKTDIFATRWTLDLVRDLFARRDAAFGGALFTLEVAGRLAAVHLALRSPGVLHGWFIAHEAEFERASPGVVLIDHILRWSAENGFRELDLGPGDYRFKLQLANRTRALAHGFVGRPSPQAFVRGAQYRLREAAEALPLGPVSALPARAMRRLDVWRGLRA